MEFTRGQTKQFKTVEENGGSSEEIKKHPEWHLILMNIFRNREKDGIILFGR